MGSAAGRARGFLPCASDGGEFEDDGELGAEGTRLLTDALWYANFMSEYDRRDYGRCPCSGVYDNRLVEVRLKLKERVIVLTEVPQGACPNCGSRVYKAEVLNRIELLMKGQQETRAQ